METNRAMKEFATYSKLFNRGAGRAELLKAARAMRDETNRRVALLNLGVMTAAEQKEIEARWASIDAVTEAECALHCQFDGLFRR